MAMPSMTIVSIVQRFDSPKVTQTDS